MVTFRAGMGVWGTAFLLATGSSPAVAQLGTAPAVQVPLTQGVMENIAPDDHNNNQAATPDMAAPEPVTPAPQAPEAPARKAGKAPQDRKIPAPVMDESLTPEDKMFNAAVEAVKEKRYGDAHSLFMPLAENSVYDAQYNIALLLKRGLGRPQDYKTALMWCWRAQLGGIRRAAALSEELTELLSEPVIEEVRTHVETGLKERISNYDLTAITQLAQFYRLMLAEPNLEESYIWFSIAAAHRLPMGIRMREEIAPDIAPERLVELQAEARKRFDTLKPPPETTDTQPTPSPASLDAQDTDQGV